MKYKTAFIGLLILIAAANTNALEIQEKDFGLGILVGEPTGFSVKYWMDEKRAVDGALAWSFFGDDAFQLHGDYLIHDYKLNNSEQWPAYYGIGALLKFEKDEGRKHDGETIFGLRIPFGMTYLFEDDSPYEFFIEIVPVLELAPNVDVSINASLGLRFYF
ncbi:MAG: hypothetical protein JW787_07585 [Sedimentisphaerales bacterium]|nr:hypothetical protein [Sedimentisphaerales bacterium]